MKSIIYLLIALLALVNKVQEIIEIPGDFEEKVFNHIEMLSGFGIRSAESDAEKRTIEYLTSEFESIGLAVSVDTFQFKGFLLNDKKIKIDNKTIEYEKIIFDPYKGLDEITGTTYFYHPKSPKEKIPDLDGKIVLTLKTANIWVLSEKNPEAIIFLSEVDFNQNTDLNNSIAVVKNNGTEKFYTSYNVIASTNKKKEKDIIVSAHWDSHCGPGANDNASGVAVMIEIARFFAEKDLPFNLKFVAFGAEELGMIGSKAFVMKHQNELKNCLYNFNIDNVGGFVGPFMALKGTESFDGESDYQVDLVARTNLNENWLGLGHHFHMDTPTITPKWLIETVNKAAEASQVKVTPIGQMGSDHRIFANKGVPSTNMCIVDTVEYRAHSLNDLPEYIEKSSLRKAGLLVINTIMNSETIVN